MTEVEVGCNEVTLKCSAMELDQLLYNTVIDYSGTKDSSKCLETLSLLGKLLRNSDFKAHNRSVTVEIPEEMLEEVKRLELEWREKQ